MKRQHMPTRAKRGKRPDCGICPKGKPSIKRVGTVDLCQDCIERLDDIRRDAIRKGTLRVTV